MTCSLKSCDRPFYAKGYCQSHYNRVRRHGDPNESVPLKKQVKRNGRYVHYLHGYVEILTPAGRKAEHRYVMEQHLGRDLLSEETVHHKNGVRDDNRLENLELWSSSHPYGQRVEDKLQWAYEMIALYSGLSRT